MSAVEMWGVKAIKLPFARDCKASALVNETPGIEVAVPYWQHSVGEAEIAVVVVDPDYAPVSRPYYLGYRLSSG